ncbi:MAG: hypothetical protein OXE57_15040 [Alphaproteobacteria bacterium]|nr:hypothetical protein [Alphaproteobacteria bacterium]
MVGEHMNGEDANFDLGKVQTVDDVKDAVDSMIDATFGVMAETGGEVTNEDRGPVLLDIVNMFDERVQALEGVQGEVAEGIDRAALQASLHRWAAARDRAVERYEGETGVTWERAGG